MKNKTKIAKHDQSYIQIMKHLYQLDNLLEEFHSTKNIYLLTTENFDQLDKKFENTMDVINYTRNTIFSIHKENKQLSYEKTSLSNISHDLRNYISGINGLANLIIEQIDHYRKSDKNRINHNIEEVSELANILEPFSQEAMQYVDDILDDCQIKTGKFNLGKIENCNITELIHHIIIFHKDFLMKNKVTLQKNIEVNLPLIKGNIRRLKQILINLITNAAKYSPENSIIQINAYSKEQKVYIEIIDDGIGMNKKELELALNGKGTEIDKSILNKSCDSRGLGLPIVKHLMDLMGDMKIDSKKGLGTKIILEFNV